MGTGPIASQLKLFATASLIVAPHGAGLSNMMVSPLHTPVLEIGPPECSSCYLHLAVKVSHSFLIFSGVVMRLKVVDLATDYLWPHDPVFIVRLASPSAVYDMIYALVESADAIQAPSVSRADPHQVNEHQV